MEKQKTTVPGPGDDRTGWMMFAHSGPLQLRTLTPEQIHLGDIAHALGRINRFNGQTREPISVLWHSLMVADLCCHEDVDTRLEALLHDAAEAYVGDWISPLKGLTGDTLVELRNRIQQTVFNAAGLDVDANALSKPVEAADLLMARYEAQHESGYKLRIPWHKELTDGEIERVTSAMEITGPPSGRQNEQEFVYWRFFKEAKQLMRPGVPLLRTLNEAQHVYRNTAERAQRG